MCSMGGRRETTCLLLRIGGMGLNVRGREEGKLSTVALWIHNTLAQLLSIKSIHSVHTFTGQGFPERGTCSLKHLQDFRNVCLPDYNIE